MFYCPAAFKLIVDIYNTFYDLSIEGIHKNENRACFYIKQKGSSDQCKLHWVSSIKAQIIMVTIAVMRQIVCRMNLKYPEDIVLRNATT